MERAGPSAPADTAVMRCRDRCSLAMRASFEPAVFDLMVVDRVAWLPRTRAASPSRAYACGHASSGSAKGSRRFAGAHSTRLHCRFFLRAFESPCTVRDVHQIGVFTSVFHARTSPRIRCPERLRRAKRLLPAQCSCVAGDFATPACDITILNAHARLLQAGPNIATMTFSCFRL
jgi:hypothetical protein